MTVGKLVATVQSAGAPVTLGSVDFFDGVKDIGSTQVVQSNAAGFTPGTATIQKILGPGSHSLTAKFHPPLSLAISVSSASQITVPGSTTNTRALYPAGSYPLPDVGAAVAVADVNGDGLPDIIVSLLDLGQVQIFLNDPSNPGHFTQGPNLAMPFQMPPTRIVVGDVDGDGLPDLLVAADGNVSGDSVVDIGDIAIFLQNPTQPGTFQSPSLLLTDLILPYNFALIDINGDGVPDIVSTGEYHNDPDYGHGVNIAIQSATSRGTFARSVHVYDSANTELSAAFADVDGDGLPDVVFSGVNYNQIEVYYSDPTNPGEFSSAAYFPEPVNIISDSLLVDVDHDGHPDLIVAEAFGGIQIFRNDPSNPGNFLSPTTYNVPDRAIGLALGDVNGDGIPDLVVPGFSNIVTTLPGTGSGQFGSPLAYTVNDPPGQVVHVAVADLDGDGLDDAVTLTSFPNGQNAPTFQLNVLLHTPSGTKPLPAVELSMSGTPTVGSSITISASVTSTFGSPTGTVTFTDGTQTLGTATLSSSGIAQLAWAATAGQQTITAHYSGDSNFLAADSLGSSIFVLGLTPTLSFTVNPATGQAGTLFSFTMKVSGSGSVPTGTVRFSQNQNGAPFFATVALDATGTATTSLGSLTKGQYICSAFYSGDSTYAQSSTSTSVTVTAGAAISLTASNTAPNATGPITFTGTVSNLPSLAGLTVSFFDYTTLVYTTTTDANGVATWQNPGLSPGSHQITAQYVAVNSGGSATSNGLSYSLPLASTAVALSASPSSPLSGQTVTLTAQVTGNISGTLPSGAVTFLEDGGVIGTANLDSSATATFTTPALKSGTHSISASFAGNSEFASSTGSISLTVPAPDFAVALDHPSLNVNAGQSGSVNIQLSPVAGFSGTVQLSCAGLPSTASCGFSNSNPTVSVSGGSSILTITVIATGAALNRKPDPHQRWPFTIVAFALVPLIFKRRRSIAAWSTFSASVLLILFLTGCGGATAPAPPPQQQTAVVQVVGTSAGVTHSSNLTLTYD